MKSNKTMIHSCGKCNGHGMTERNEDGVTLCDCDYGKALKGQVFMKASVPDSVPFKSKEPPIFTPFTDLR